MKRAGGNATDGIDLGSVLLSLTLLLEILAVAFGSLMPLTLVDSWATVWDALQAGLSLEIHPPIWATLSSRLGAKHYAYEIRLNEVEDEQRLHRRWTNRLREWLELRLPRPAYASSLLLAAVMIGASAAVVRLGYEAETQRNAAARQYFTSIDPLRMPFPE